METDKVKVYLDITPRHKAIKLTRDTFEDCLEFIGDKYVAESYKSPCPGGLIWIVINTCIGTRKKVELNDFVIKRMNNADVVFSKKSSEFYKQYSTKPDLSQPVGDHYMADARNQTTCYNCGQSY